MPLRNSALFPGHQTPSFFQKPRACRLVSVDPGTAKRERFSALVRPHLVCRMTSLYNTSRPEVPHISVYKISNIKGRKWRCPQRVEIRVQIQLASGHISPNHRVGMSQNRHDLLFCLPPRHAYHIVSGEQEVSHLKALRCEKSLQFLGCWK